VEENFENDEFVFYSSYLMIQKLLLLKKNLKNKKGFINIYIYN